MAIKKVLVVDDSPTDQHYLRELLGKSGYEATLASGGEEALAKAKTALPDLILMDVVMPGLNGFQATRQLTQDAATKHIPVIICTTKNQETDIVEARSEALDEVRLAVRAGSRNWLLRLPDVGEVVSVPRLVPVPRTHAWFRGVGNARGSLYAVVDLAAFMGDAPVEAGAAARLLLVGRRHGVNSALLVERVLGLRKLADFAPDFAPGADPTPPVAWAGAAYQDGSAARWVQLEVGALLAAKRFQQIAA
jgi:CheY-like chemotaxis protein